IKTVRGEPDGARIPLRIGLRANNEEDPPNSQSVLSARNAEGRTEWERRISMRKHAVALASFLILLDAAKSLKVRAELIGPATYDPGAEASMFRDIVAKQPPPSGICLSAARPEFFRADIDKAIAAGIPVICVDADVPESRRVMYIGTDNVKAGKESVKRMAALAPKGNIVVISIP